jgi:hypothetical protein
MKIIVNYKTHYNSPSPSGRGEIYQALVFRNVVAQFIGLPFVIARSEATKQSAPSSVFASGECREAISWGYEIATPSTHGAECWARNDKSEVPDESGLILSHQGRGIYTKL